MSILGKEKGRSCLSFFVLLLTIASLFSTLFSTASAKLASEGSIVGVEAGDWAKYCIQESSQLVGFAEIEVTDVSGTNLTVQVSRSDYHQNNTVVGDVTEGLRGNFGILGDVPFIFPRDFNISSINETFVNSFGFLSAWLFNFTWNTETLIRKYGEASREVNLIVIEYAQYLDVFLAEWHIEYCWDKATGIVLEASYTYYPTNGSYVWGPNHFETMWVSATNLFQISRPFQLETITLIAVVVAPSAFGISALVVKNWMNRRRSKARQTG